MATFWNESPERKLFYMNDRDKNIIRQIIGYCLKINAAVVRFGDKYEAFSNDEVYRDVCAMYILQIGELTTLLSDNFKSVHTGIPWNEIKAMRNIVAHGYGKITVSTLWETVQMDIPALKVYCEGIKV
jgi:uncharacterized protein with HEPN domain